MRAIRILAGFAVSGDIICDSAGQPRGIVTAVEADGIHGTVDGVAVVWHRRSFDPSFSTLPERRGSGSLRIFRELVTVDE